MLANMSDMSFAISILGLLSMWMVVRLLKSTCQEIVFWFDPFPGNSSLLILIKLLRLTVLCWSIILLLPAFDPLFFLFILRFFTILTVWTRLISYIYIWVFSFDVVHMMTLSYLPVMELKLNYLSPSLHTISSYYHVKKYIKNLKTIPFSTHSQLLVSGVYVYVSDSLKLA